MGTLLLMVRLLIDIYRTAEYQPGRLRGERRLMMMIAFITFKSSLVPLLEGL